MSLLWLRIFIHKEKEIHRGWGWVNDRFFIFGGTVPLIAGYYWPNTTNCTVALRSACLSLTLRIHILEPNLSTSLSLSVPLPPPLSLSLTPPPLSLASPPLSLSPPPPSLSLSLYHTMAQGHILPSILSLCGKHCCQATTKAGRMKVELYLCICGFVHLHEQQVYAGVLSDGCTVRGRNSGIIPVLKWDCLHYWIWTPF